jgi:hypothetical protein
VGEDTAFDVGVNDSIKMERPDLKVARGWKELEAAGAEEMKEEESSFSCCESWKRRARAVRQRASGRVHSNEKMVKMGKLRPLEGWAPVLTERSWGGQVGQHWSQREFGCFFEKHFVSSARCS